MSKQTPSQAASAANTASAIQAGGEVASLAFNTISTISDTKQRGRFAQNLALLTSEQKVSLDKALSDANSEIERIKIIKDVLNDLQAKRIDLLVAGVTEKEKKNRTNTYIAAGAFILVGIGIIALIVKKS